MGVFNSWLTLATKSRRTVSNRRASVTSTARSKMKPRLSGEMCTSTVRNPFSSRTAGSRTISRSRGRRSRRTLRMASVSVAGTTRSARTNPMTCAAPLERTTTSSGPTTTEGALSASRTSTRPGASCDSFEGNTGGLRVCMPATTMPMPPTPKAMPNAAPTPTATEVSIPSD